MALSSSFFDAVLTGGTYDRSYDASDFANYFATLVGNGVFANPTSNFQVRALMPVSMSVRVSPGSAWINGYLATNTTDFELSVDAANSTYPRIDAVCLRWRREERDIFLSVKKGIPESSPQSPTITRNDDVYELYLAKILVPAGATSIAQSVITDARPNAAECGWVTGLLEQIDTTDLFAQFTNAFNVWFANVQAQLEGDVAANLQNQINGLQSSKVPITRTINGLDLSQNRSLTAQHVGALSLPIAITVNGTDLNTITSPGMYCCPSSAVASSLLNCPTGLAFCLLVEKTTDGGSCKQTLTRYHIDAPETWIRTIYVGTFGTWRRVSVEGTGLPYASDLHTLSVGGLYFTDTNTLNTPYKEGMSTAPGGTCLVSFSTATYQTLCWIPTGSNNMYLKSRTNGTWGTWTHFAPQLYVRTDGTSTMAGDLKHNRGTWTGVPLQVINATGSSDGAAIVLQAGGATYIGGGEAGTALRGALGVADNAERLFLASDSTIDIYTNCQTIASRKVAMTMDASGRTIIPVPRLGSLWTPIFTRTTAGAFTWTAPDYFAGGSYTIGVVIVGGGGSGASINRGGYFSSRYIVWGGASGFSTFWTQTVNPGTNYSGSVGAGGTVPALTGSTDYWYTLGSKGNPGGSTAFAGVTVLGGQGGYINSDPNSLSAWHDHFPDGGAIPRMYADDAYAQIGSAITSAVNPTSAGVNQAGINPANKMLLDYPTGNSGGGRRWMSTGMSGYDPFGCKEICCAGGTVGGGYQSIAGIGYRGYLASNMYGGHGVVGTYTYTGIVTAGAGVGWGSGGGSAWHNYSSGTNRANAGAGAPGAVVIYILGVG